ncbi:hypothetical protein EVAR_29462_1 [Eumeta japonica]|uniref:Uncharacterized protein n=1 Tax=Eumeta variegata TaxID=151549 RepID=A0A4C1WSC1_EUMVA|nr:hypothetical protein EVAR_29462_1 [Eumeta japonica]
MTSADADVVATASGSDWAEGPVCCYEFKGLPESFDKGAVGPGRQTPPRLYDQSDTGRRHVLFEAIPSE